MAEQTALMNWLANGERGISSNTMVQHLTGIDTLRDWNPNHPQDPDDLYRCRLLLEAPRWRDGHGSAPKTYWRMRALIEAGQTAPPLTD